MPTPILLSSFDLLGIYMIHCAGREDLFEEDIGEQAVEEELAPLTVQLALVQSRLGRHADALATMQVHSNFHRQAS